MVINTEEVRDVVVGHFMLGVSAFQNLTLLDVGIGLVGVGVILGANECYKSWRKKRGYRMVLRERRNKIDRLLEDILTDGLLQADVDGKISAKEHGEELQRLYVKLGLTGLVPHKRRLSEVKNEIKGRLNKGPKGKKPSEPITGKPRLFKERVGTFANQFWRAKGA